MIRFKKIIFFAQNKKTYQIKPLFDQRKTWRHGIWIVMTNLAL